MAMSRKGRGVWMLVAALAALPPVEASDDDFD